MGLGFFLFVFFSEREQTWEGGQDSIRRIKCAMVAKANHFSVRYQGSKRQKSKVRYQF